MIGNHITGADAISGQKVEGIVLDKIMMLHTLEMRTNKPVDLGAPRPATPVVIDTYLVLNTLTKGVHFVIPSYITSVQISDQEDPLTIEELNGIIYKLTEENQELKQHIETHLPGTGYIMAMPDDPQHTEQHDIIDKLRED